MSSPEITEIIGRMNRGERGAFDELLAAVYKELRLIAREALQRERKDHTLQPTALVHELYLKLQDGGGTFWDGRAHFFGAAARTMRQILVDHARRARAKKRGGDWQRIGEQQQVEAPDSSQDWDLLALDEALEQLGREDERKARAVELRYFGGLNNEEAAQVLGVTARTVERDWKFALAWLFQRMSRESP